MIRASEIGEYNYCSRAWWYKHVAKLAPGGEVSERLEAGSEAQRKQGREDVLRARSDRMGESRLVGGRLVLMLALAILAE